MPKRKAQCQTTEIPQAQPQSLCHLYYHLVKAKAKIVLPDPLLSPICAPIATRLTAQELWHCQTDHRTRSSLLQQVTHLPSLREIRPGTISRVVLLHGLQLLSRVVVSLDQNQLKVLHLKQRVHRSTDYLRLLHGYSDMLAPLSKKAGRG